MRIGVIVGAVAAFALALGIAGCSGGGGGSNLPDPTIRFVNASPDSNPLDYYVDADKKAGPLSFLDTSAAVSVKDGTKDITVRDTVSATDLDAIVNTYSDDQLYIALNYGLQNPGSDTDKRLQLTTFSYDKNAPNGNKARLIVLHTFNRAAGFSTPGIDFQNPGDNPQFKLSNINYGTSGILTVDSDTPQVFEARRAETENVYATATKTFDAGGIYLALVTGVEGGAGTAAPSIQYIKLN